MASKAVIAIAAAIIIIAGGVAAYLLMNGNGDSPEKKTDTLRTDLAVGDYIEISVEMTGSSETTMQQSEQLYLYTLYPDISSYYIATGEKVLTYKGQEMTCTIYGMDGLAFGYYMCDGVCYGNFYGEDDPLETLLVDTNFDLSKTKEQQNIKKGDYIKSRTGISGTFVITQNTVGTYDEETGEWNIIVKAYTEKPTVQNSKQTIVAIDGDKLTVKDAESESETITKADFLSVISYSNMLQYFKEKGYEYELGKKTSEKMDTVYGERQVDVQTIKYVESGTTYTALIYYCGDVIYQVSLDGAETSIVSKFVETSLITPAN